MNTPCNVILLLSGAILYANCALGLSYLSDFLLCNHYLLWLLNESKWQRKTFFFVTFLTLLALTFFRWMFKFKGSHSLEQYQPWNRKIGFLCRNFLGLYFGFRFGAEQKSKANSRSRCEGIMRSSQIPFKQNKKPNPSSAIWQTLVNSLSLNRCFDHSKKKLECFCN